MGRASASVEIACSPERAFDFLSDLENDARWVKNWHSQRVSEARGEGAMYRRWYKNPFGKDVETTVAVTRFVRPTQLWFESRSASGAVFVEFLLEPTAGGVRVTKTEDMRYRGVMGVLYGAAGFMFRKEMVALLTRLKQVLEADAA
jgi:uncharacterized protein YndB with AHSA1/START domain